MARPAGSKNKKAEFVTKDQFEGLEKSVLSLVEMVRERITPPAVKAVSITPPVASEGESDYIEVNPHWRKVVNEVLGSDFDCQILYPKSGGIQFTVIVPINKSNAPKEYLERHKTDRRTREIGNRGIEGVKEHCLRIKQNLGIK